MRVLPAFLAAGMLVALAGTRAWSAGLISGGYTLNWDQNVARADTGTTDTTTLKHAVEVKYKGFLSPVIENEITLKIDQTTSNTEPEKIGFFPVINLGYKGSYWNAGAKRTIDDTGEADRNPKIADAYFLEFFHVPSRNTLPDLKAKYTLDKDSEEGQTDTERQTITASSVYRPNSWLEVKGEYDRNINKDNLQPGTDDGDEKIAVTTGIRHLVSSKVKLDLQYKAETSHGSGSKKDETHTFKSLVAMRPFRDTTLDTTHDYELKVNRVNGERGITRNTKFLLDQKLGELFNLKGDFSRNITQVVHAAVDDTHKQEDTWTGEFRAKLSKILDFTAKHQVKHLREVHSDLTQQSPTIKNTTVTESATWTGELTRIWKASASFDRTVDYLWLHPDGREIKSAINDKYSLKTTLDFKEINLTVDPSYELTFKDDRQKNEETETRDLKVKFAYKLLTTRNIDMKVDHTYDRKVDTALNNIQRTDSSNANLMWKDPVPGWTIGFDLTRTGTDTSEDDLPPDITSAFGFKADYKFERITLATSYKFDKKELTDDAETFDFKVGWVAPSWDVALTYSFNKTFSEALNENYTIGLAFKYNL